MVESVFKYYTGVHSVDFEGKKATFYLLNTSPNRDNWAVSAKGLDEALPTLLNKPIGLGVNYEPGHDDQVGELRDVGVFCSTENKGNYALGTATINDKKALDLIKAGRLGPVSVVIQPYRVACSKCGNKWSSPDTKQLCDGAYEVLDSFVFTRVDFVETPAYPQAGLLGLAASLCIESNSSVPLPLLAAAYEGSQTTKNKTRDFGEKDMSMSENEKTQIAKLSSDFAGLSASFNALKASYDELKGRFDVLETENKQYKAAQHAALVEKALAARKAANLGDETVDRITFVSFNAAALETVIADANKTLAAKKAAAGKQGKTGTDQTFDEQETPADEGGDDKLDSVTAAINKRREARGFSPVNASGNVKPGEGQP